VSGTAPDDDLGGDPACWLDRVCPECGGFVDDDDDHVCRPSVEPAAEPPGAASTPP
jgi:hypothetical protein